LVEVGADFLVGAEPVDFCSKSHITQLSQGLVDEVPAAELWKEYLAVVVCEPLVPVEIRGHLWFCVKVAVVDPAIGAIGPFDLWVNT
jgi:hypothetical protein